jgi:hypothetical protein
MGYGWRKLWDVDFTEAAWADAGTSTPGARTIGGKAAVIVNPSSNFLAAAAGVSVVSGTGLKFDTTGCTTGPNDDLTHSLGAGVYWLLTTLIPAALYPATIPGPEKYWMQLAAVARFDLSGCNGDGEGIGIGFGGNTTFGSGSSACCVRASGAVAGIGSQYAATYASATSSIAQLGMASAPDSAMVTTGYAGVTPWWGTSDGSRYWPRDWYTRDGYLTIAAVNSPTSGGSVIRSTTVLSVSVFDTAKTAALPVVKRIALFGRYQGTMSPMGPSSHHFIAA